jgi:WD40 repeat protein
LIHAFPAHAATVWCVQFSPDGKLLASAGHDGSIKLWNVASLDNSRHLPANVQHVQDLAFSPNDSSLAVISSNGTCTILDVVRGVELGSIAAPGPASRLSYTTDGKSIFVAYRDGSLIRWNTADASFQKLAVAAPGEPSCLSAISDGRHVLMAYGLRRIQMWDAVTGKCVRDFVLGDDMYLHFAMAADRRSFVAVSVSGHTRLFDIRNDTSRCSVHLRDHVGANSVAFAANGKLAAIGRGDGSIVCWNCQSESPLRILSGNVGSPVHSLAFSPDGRTIAAGGNSGVVKLWHVGTGQEAATLASEGAIGHQLIVRFSHDGQMLVACSERSGSPPRSRIWYAPREQN